MSIEWYADLETGLEWMDEQHRELVAKISELIEAIDKGYSIDELLGIVEFLEGYVIVHFGAEERVMGEHDYPDAALHFSEHVRFISSVNEIKEKIEIEGPNNFIALEARRSLLDWLINHIGDVDKKLGIFVSKAEAPSFT